MLLDQKVVLVSGIGPGLGIKLALESAKEGARAVVLIARRAHKLDQAEEQIKAIAPECKVVKAVSDITDEAQCRSAVDLALSEAGAIDVLVNNAFLHGNFEPVETADLALWRQVIQTNLIGTMQISQAVIPAMKSQGSGAIVMINTQSVRKPFMGESGYAASKAALGAAAKYLALELGQYGIRVNSAHMGWMWGVPVQEYMAGAALQHKVPEQSLIDDVSKNIPLGKIPTDTECAKAALFLASDYASAMTGAIIDVNGGEYMPC